MCLKHNYHILNQLIHANKLLGLLRNHNIEMTLAGHEREES